jgi:hypothetical protein
MKTKAKKYTYIDGDATITSSRPMDEILTDVTERNRQAQLKLKQDIINDNCSGPFNIDDKPLSPSRLRVKLGNSPVDEPEEFVIRSQDVRPLGRNHRKRFWMFY